MARVASHPAPPSSARKKKLGVRLLARLAPVVYRLWSELVWRTSAVDDRVTRDLAARAGRGERIVLVMLHQDVFAAPRFLAGARVCGLASTGDAGDVIDAVMRSLGHENVRGGSSEGSSRRRTLGALRDLIRFGNAREGFVIAITPDGSKGPAGACKPGFALVALETRASVVCIHVHASRALFLPTWDRTMIPLPFSRIWAETRELGVIPNVADAAALEDVRVRAEAALAELHASAFATSGRRAVPALARHRPPER